MTFSWPFDISVEWSVSVDDMWIGGRWQTSGNKLSVWICLAPCLPIKLTIKRVIEGEAREESAILPETAASVREILAGRSDLPYTRSKSFDSGSYQEWIDARSKERE